jgi:putative addiction module component (TIGR02574 family)
MSRSATMSMTLAEIEAEVQKLSPEERRQLADSIYAGLDEDVALDPHDIAEAQRRAEELRSGAVQGESWEEVLASLRGPAA